MTDPALRPIGIGQYAAPQIPGAALPAWHRFNLAANRGLGRLGETLFAAPAEVAQQMDPRTVHALQQQALLQMGLGLMAARNRGLGAGALFGMNQGQQTMGQGLGQAMLGRRSRLEDERLDLQERRTDALLDRQTGRDRIEDARYEAQRAWQQQRDTALDAERRTDNARQAAALRLQTEAGARDAQQDRLKMAGQRAAIEAGRYLSTNPNGPRAAEMRGLYKTFTGRDWDGGMDPFARLLAPSPSYPRLDDLPGVK